MVGRHGKANSSPRLHELLHRVSEPTRELSSCPILYIITAHVRALVDVLFISSAASEERVGAAAAATLSKNAIKGSLRRNSGAKEGEKGRSEQPEPETENNLREFLPQFPVISRRGSIARHSPVLQSVSGEDSLGLVRLLEGMF